VVELNRAVAVAMAFGYERGLAKIDALLARGDLESYVHAHSARADLLRRMGRADEAREAYERALALTSQEPGRRFLRRRLAALG
jgi:RNA polymerase sigma-70 factor (ECF subfamily)